MINSVEFEIINSSHTQKPVSGTKKTEMARKKETAFRSELKVGLITTVFGFLLTVVYDFWKEKPILTTLVAMFKSLVRLAWRILDFDLKVWWILAFVFLLIVVASIINKLRKEEDAQPDFLSYREDQFKNWKWTWSWRLSSRTNKYVISDLNAHCPKCDTQMMGRYDDYSLLFTCPRCEFTAMNEQCDQPSKVETIIFDNIRRKESKAENESSTNR